MKEISIFLFSIIGLAVHAQVVELSDEFNSACSLSDWTNITQAEGWDAEHFEVYDINESNVGELTLMPWTSAWYADYRGGYLFKEISGNFVVTTQVHVTDRDGLFNLPNSTYSLGGIMVRTPTGRTEVADWMLDQENYVFLSIGRGSSGSTFQYEVKNTTNGNSNLNLSPISTNVVNIRMVRKDNAILVLNQIPGQSWQVHARYNRPDMPADMQIGFVSYTDWPNVQNTDVEIHNNTVLNDDYNNTITWRPDIIARFDYARFEEVDLPTHLVNLNFASTTTVPNDTIIEYFGQESLSPYAEGSAIWLGSVNSDWNNVANWQNAQVPVAGDIVVIDRCNCTEVFAPEIDFITPDFAGMILRSGASLSITQTATLNLDLSTEDSSFINEGEIVNNGSIIIENCTGKEVRNIHLLELGNTGVVEVRN